VLRNPYYKGLVVWNGRSYAGRHQPLVDEDTFDRVQELLAAARVYGERPQKHEHYLRGTVVCAECLGRLLYGRHRSASGRQYDYFCCNNRSVRRKQVSCSSGHFAVEAVEEEVLDLYRTLKLPPETQDQIRQELSDELRERTALISRAAERHARALKAIEAKQEKLLQLYYDDLVTREVFVREREKLKAERQAARAFERAATSQISDVEQALELALSRLDEPHEVYRDATDLERRVANRSIFERIEVGPEGLITGTTLTPRYRALNAWDPGLGRPRALQAEGAAEQSCSVDVRPLPAPVHRF
jgi:site-specific DNA recombinase